MKLAPFASPYSFTFIDPDTSYKYTANSQKELETKIKGYREQNRLEPIEALSQVLENYWCALPENVGKCTPYKLHRSWLQTIRGGIALIFNFAYETFVSQAVAENRARICSSCPFNIKPEKGKFDAWADEVAIATIGDRKTSYDSELGTCNICSCPLRCKVFYGGKIELTEEEISQMPSSCWQKKEVLAYGK